MSESSSRITCPNCQASNYPTSEVCWRCGQPLPRETAQTPPQDPYRMRPLPDAPPSQDDNTQLLAILGFVFAILGLLCCPFFALIGIYLGVVLHGRGDTLGIWIISISILFFVISLTIAVYMIWLFMRDPELWETLTNPGMRS